MKKLFLLAALFTAGLMNAQSYRTIGDMATGQPWGNGGYSTVIKDNSGVHCMGQGGWDCTYPFEWGGSEWGYANINTMLEYTAVKFNADINTGSYVRTFINQENGDKETLKVNWFISQNMYCARLYRMNN